VSIDLDAAYGLDEQVSLRPEPFGALAYHFGNRRLTFLRSPDIVAVVEGLSSACSLADALRAASIDERRWPSFTKALGSLEASDMIHRRA
jgi:putative mycofactocin binding protein MftB